MRITAHIAALFAVMLAAALPYASAQTCDILCNTDADCTGCLLGDLTCETVTLSTAPVGCSGPISVGVRVSLLPTLFVSYRLCSCPGAACFALSHRCAFLGCRVGSARFTRIYSVIGMSAILHPQSAAVSHIARVLKASRFDRVSLVSVPWSVGLLSSLPCRRYHLCRAPTKHFWRLDDAG